MTAREVEATCVSGQFQAMINLQAIFGLDVSSWSPLVPEAALPLALLASLASWRFPEQTT